MDGFSGADLALGTVTGYRWWAMTAPPLHLSPARAGAAWNPGLLTGMWDTWQPGDNTASCRARPSGHPADDVPSAGCRCGYWAYWSVQPHDMGKAGMLPVLGVIEGWGNVLAGPQGFRCSQAKIIALHLPFTIQPDALPDEPDDRFRYRVHGSGQHDPSGRHPAMTYGRHNPWWNHPQFSGRVIDMGGDSGPQYPYQQATRERPAADEIEEAAVRAEAWMAVIGDRLAVMYPDAQMYETEALLRAQFPPSSQYADLR